GSELRYRDGRGVRGQDDFRSTDLVEIAKNLGLDIEAFGGSLYNKIASGELCTPHNRFDVLEGSRPVRGGDFVFSYVPVKIFCDGVERSVQKTLFYVAQQHVKSGAGEDMSYAVAHGSCPYDSNNFNLHEVSPTRKTSKSIRSRSQQSGVSIQESVVRSPVSGKAGLTPSGRRPQRGIMGFRPETRHPARYPLIPGPCFLRSRPYRSSRP